jgi:TetR/AcrR family transcriptional regulator, cholesterol catabolism regulator
MAGLRERKKREKRERIRAAAASLFRARGYEATTTREIAERAGIGAGTLFLYVQDKRELLLLVYEGGIEAALESAWATLPAGVPLPRRLHHLFVGLFDMYGQDEALSLHFVREQVFAAGGPRSERLESLRRELFGRIAEEVARAQGAGEMRADVSGQQVAWNAFALYFATLSGWLAGLAGRAEADALLLSALELQFTGLCGDAPDPPRG